MGVHGAINRGAMFQHNWLMVFFQMVIAFMPVPCFENLFTDLVFVAMFLVGTVFTLNMLPEVLLKDFFFINFFVFFMMPLLPLAFSCRRHYRNSQQEQHRTKGIRVTRVRHRSI